MLAPIDISTGQVSGVDDLSSATSTVVNWEADESGINRPRPGLTSYIAASSFGGSQVIGLTHWQNYTVVVTADRKLWAVDDANPGVVIAASDSTAGSKLEGSLRPVFVSGGIYVYVTGGGRIQRWRRSDILSSVLSSSPSCTHIAALGQRLVSNEVGNDSAVRWSDIGEGAWGTWPAANTMNADARPDDVISLAESGLELYVWGDSTLEVYGVGSDPTIPFEQANSVDVGLGAPHAFARLPDAMFAFLDDHRRVVISEGRTIKVVSDAIQGTLRSLTTISDCWIFREERGQYSLLVVRFPTEKRTFVYDLKAEKWQGERRRYVSPFNTADWPVTSHLFVAALNRHMFGSSAVDGQVDTYAGDTTNSQLGQLEIRTQDEGEAWGDWDMVTVSDVYDQAQVVDLFPGGVFKRRRYDVRFSLTTGELAGAMVCERTTGWQDFGIANRKRSGRLRATMRRGADTFSMVALNDDVTDTGSP